MRLVLNGREREVPEGTTVADLVALVGLGPRTVVVERNGEPLERERFPDVVLEDGDVLEIVRPVQGGGGARAGLERARLYFVVSSPIKPDVLVRVIDGGVDLVQLRLKDADAAEIIRTGAPLLELCRERGVPFVVNDRPDVALALGADGVHLGQDDLPPEVARRILGPEAILGRSTHAESDVERALAEHEKGWADYVAVGPVFETPTKPGRPAVGLELVRRVAARGLSVPWFAVGGIDASNVQEVVAAGARRIAVVRAIATASDPAGAARRLREAL